MIKKIETKDNVALDCVVPETDLEQVLTTEERKVSRKRYLSDYIKDAYKGWENGRVVFDAGTGTGKTSFIINQLLPWALARSKKLGRLIKILLLCNRVSLKSQSIRKIIECGVGIDLTQYDSPDALDEMELNASNSRFIRVWTYQKIEYWQQRKPEWVKKWLDSYTYIVCDEAHYFVADLAGYITEHMGQPMTKKEIRQNVAMRAQLGAKPGRAKSEGVTMAAVKEELKRYSVQIVKYGERKHQKGEPQYYTFAEL